jgi:hypothetical protein
MTSSCNGLEHDSSSERQQQQHSRRSEASKQFRTGHPSLSTWNPPLHHNFSPKQMQVLTCLCDTLVPSIPPPPLHLLDDETNHCSSIFKSSLGIQRNLQDVNDFYKLSASDAGIPAVVAGAITEVLKPNLLQVISIILWFLSTAIGCFLLGGWATVSGTFPYIRSYPCLGREQQERMLQGWSCSRIREFCAIFKLFKSVTLWAYYCKVQGFFSPNLHSYNSFVFFFPSNFLCVSSIRKN